MVHIVYYSPHIPSIRSTVRYVHAKAVPVHMDAATLVTESDPPEELRELYDDVRVLREGPLRNAWTAAHVARNVARSGSQTLFLTTFHYAPALSGALVDLPWVVDVFDNPLQYAYNNPRSHHALTARLLIYFLDRADGAVHDYHHTGPAFGQDSRFITEGYPTDLINPRFEPPVDEFRGIWAGSPRLDRGMDILFKSLSRIDNSIIIDVYGETSPKVVASAQRHDVADRLVFHGPTDHGEVCDRIGEAQVGFCVLPARPDWRHSSPLKIREYMAGGTIPICSNFSGMRLTAELAGVYTDPTPAALAATMRQLIEMAQSEPNRFVQRMQTSRQRAETRPLHVAGEWFVKQAASSGLAVEPF